MQSLQLAISATDVTQKYIMNVEGRDKWDKAQWEAFKHDNWKLMQELRDDYYRLYENNDSQGEDKEKVMKRIEWEEKEEKAKEEYFRIIAEEEKRGYKRQAVSELREERSAEKQKERERLNNLKRMEKEEAEAKEKEEGNKEVEKKKVRPPKEEKS